MNEQEALLANVCACPDDDAPLLIFADWLEEHGDASERARAEFIRLQIEVEQLEEWSPQRTSLEERADELLEAHREEWQQSLPGWADPDPYLPGFSSPYRRGFLRWVGAKPEDFVERADELFRAAPVRGVKFFPIRDGGRLLATSPGLAQLRHVDLTFTETRVDLPDLLASPYLSDLATLNFHFSVPHSSAHRLLPK